MFPKRIRDMSIGWVIVPILIFLFPSISESIEGPALVIENLHTQIISVMKSAEVLGYQGRYETLRPVIETSYDLPYIAQKAVGRFWREFNVEEKKRFLDSFSKLSIATYADRFDGYSGESFVLNSTEELETGRALVKCFLIKKDSGRIPLDYILQKKEGLWRIVNVCADGISELSLKRSEYTTILKQSGFESLINKMDEKIIQMRQ